MSVPVLQVEGITKRYGQLLVSDDINLSLDRGARHALIGPNGAGKSTLVGILSGTIGPDAGRIVLDGDDVTAQSAVCRTNLGLGRTFQITNLFPRLSLLENIFLAISERTKVGRNLWRPAWSYRALIDEAERIAVTLDLADCIHRRLSEISYGQQRLAEIAVTLSLRPKVLLLDEPAAGIPKQEISAVMNAVRRLPAETAVLLIEHDMFIVREFASQVSVLVEGRVTASGSPFEILSSDDVKAVYLGRRSDKTKKKINHVQH